MAEKMLRLPIRFCRLGRIYGPGMPDLGPEGLMDKLLEKPTSQVGFVSVHCWNLGEVTGPYPIGPDEHCPGHAADWVATAHQIIAQRIKPAMEAARKAGITVFHVATGRYAPRYPTYAEIAEDPELRSPSQPVKFERCVRPRTREEQWGDELGPDFPGAVWETHPDIFDIAEAVRPLPDEPVLLDGWQLNGLCRRLDVDTLFYVGFMADVCLLNSPGAIREMATKLGYRCVVLRDCTVAYEFADTYEGGWMTKAAIRVIESGLGYSVSSGDFIAAATKAAGEAETATGSER